MSDLDDFIKEITDSSPFIKWEDGEPIKGIYGGCMVIDDTFNKGEKTVEYAITVNDIEKTFKSRSVKLAMLMKKIKKGDEVQIVRTGESLKTLWYVEKIEP